MTRCLPPVCALVVLATAHAQTSVVSSTALPASGVYYDQARSRLVFGMSTGEVWEWDDLHWARSSATFPSSSARITYDTTRDRAFYIGPSGRLYSFDGHTTADHGVSPLPGGSQLLSDTGRGLLVGFLGTGTAVSVYEWDGATWQVAVPMGPSRILVSAAYDENLGVIVAEVINLSGTVGRQTLHGDGTGWTVQAQGGSTRNGLVYDPVTRSVLSVTATTWQWNGSTWTQLPVAPTPNSGTVCADPAHNRLLLWTSGATAQLWIWDGIDWTATGEKPFPILSGSGLDFGFTFDGARGRAVLLANDRHTEWDGTQWHPVTASPAPPERTGHGQVFDAARGETLVFGGLSGATVFGDTWGFDGTSWRLAATTGPSPRLRAATAYDAGRSRVVLFGGTPGTGALEDHWEWDGASWTLIAATTPIGQVLGAMGYDPQRGVLVLLDNLARTWEHNGTGWIQRAVGGPSSVGVDQLVWNPMTQRLAANLSEGATGIFREEWDGVQWTRLLASYGRLAHDTVRDAMLVLNAIDLRTESLQSAGVTDYGSPCGGATIPTSLTAFGQPRPGDPAFHLDLRADAAQRPAVIAFAFASANVSIGNGCSLLLQNPFGARVWFTDPHGFWSTPLALPADLALRGVTLLAQGGVLDPASPGGIALTQGLRIAIGD